MTSATAPQTSWLDEIPARLADIERAHLLRRRRVVQPAGGARLLVDGRSMLAFCSNDYLGLAGHPALAEAARAATYAYGVGSGGSPLVSGHSAANDALELNRSGIQPMVIFSDGARTMGMAVESIVDIMWRRQELEEGDLVAPGQH